MIKLHFRDWLYLKQLLEDLEDPTMRDLAVLSKITEIIKHMKQIHAYKDREGKKQDGV